MQIPACIAAQSQPEWLSSLTGLVQLAQAVRRVEAHAESRTDQDQAIQNNQNSLSTMLLEEPANPKRKLEVVVDLDFLLPNASWSFRKLGYAK